MGSRIPMAITAIVPLYPAVESPTDWVCLLRNGHTVSIHIFDPTISIIFRSPPQNSLKAEHERDFFFPVTPVKSS